MSVQKKSKIEKISDKITSQDKTDYEKEYRDCLEYIDKYWDMVTHKPSRQLINHHLINIPYEFITPNHKKFMFIFYWDTFFMFRGLIRTKREHLMKAMVENFIYLLNTYGEIPNFNSPASMGRSQPPFFSSMILDTYNGYLFAYLRKNKFLRVFDNLDKHKKWLKAAIKYAKEEYERVWIDKDKLFHHSVDGYILNRYGDRDIGYSHSSELESGWDFTSRYYNRCDEFLPIDLNVYLFKYERDFAKIAFHLENKEEEKAWKEKATFRKEEINKFMWSEKEGFFFDYCYTEKRKSKFLSLAGFTPLWAGLASKEQAAKVVKKLPIFETEYGLTITAKESMAPKIDMSQFPEMYRPAIEEIVMPKQWDYPHSWPPIEYLTAIGLLKYGYIDDAKRLMNKYLKTHAMLFRKYGTFFEKIDVIKGERGHNSFYLNQDGFGWTNAIFYRYIEILKSLNNGEELYAQPKADNPPYKLSIPH